jgi:leucyl-tRNA synthetase
VPTGTHAVNPVNGRQMPIFVADYVLPSYGTGAIMAVPAHDQRDLEFARRYGLPVVQAIRPSEGDWPSDRAYEGTGMMVNSGAFDGQPSAAAWHGIADMMVEQAHGRRSVQYRMRDWLISRQRYWGAPIPIIHCTECGPIPVPKENLPVRLPHMPDYQPRGDGRSPLANRPDFVHAPCPSCGGSGRRETDTMGGFACSSWYFLRFSDPDYDTGPFNPQALQRWLPVDLYVGGAEHAVMHLLYSRFWTKVLADAGLIHFREPFPRLRSQGVLHASDGKRMSKSRGNVVTPDEVVERHGADVLRIYLLFMAPFDRNVTWDEDGIAGSERFLQRVWRVCLSGQDSNSAQGRQRSRAVGDEACRSILRATHRTILRVTKDVEAFKFNTAVAAMMELTNILQAHLEQRGPSPAFHEATGILIRLLAPFAPHVAEELWARRGGAFSVHQEAWPTHDPELVVDEIATLVIQVNGKVRDRIQVPAGLDDEEARLRALESDKVQRYLGSRQPRRVVVVPGRLVNFVV